MYEKLAWNNFEKTGDIESFLEYRKFMEVNEELNIDNKIMQNIGELLNEIDKSKGNSN